MNAAFVILPCEYLHNSGGSAEEGDSLDEVQCRTR